MAHHILLSCFKHGVTWTNLTIAFFLHALEDSMSSISNMQRTTLHY